VPVPCGSCAAPVHERAVTCPHCGLATGNPPDRTLTAEERAAAVDLARMQNDKYDPDEGGYSGPYVYSPDLAIVGAAVVVGAVVKSAVEAVASERAERESRPELPRAIARERTGPQPVIPDPSKEPEPAPPPSDKPRFLK
jgi:hypothetical protein